MIEREIHYLCYHLPLEDTRLVFDFMTTDRDIADEWSEAFLYNTTHAHKVNRFTPCGDKCKQLYKEGRSDS